MAEHHAGGRKGRNSGLQIIQAGQVEEARRRCMCVYLQRTENKVLKERTGISNTGFHQLWLQVQRDKLRTFRLCATHRPPDCPTTYFIDDFMDRKKSLLRVT